MTRYAFFIYGVAAHALFLLTYAYMAGFFGNFIVPKSIDSQPSGPLASDFGKTGVLNKSDRANKGCNIGALHRSGDRKEIRSVSYVPASGRFKRAANSWINTASKFRSSFES